MLPFRGFWYIQLSKDGTLYFNVQNVLAYSTFVVWIVMNPAWRQGTFFKRRLFLEELEKAMMAALIQRHQHIFLSTISQWISERYTRARSELYGHQETKGRGAICVHQEMSMK